MLLIKSIFSNTSNQPPESETNAFGGLVIRMLASRKPKITIHTCIAYKALWLACVWMVIFGLVSLDQSLQNKPSDGLVPFFVLGEDIRFEAGCILLGLLKDVLLELAE